MVIIMGYDVVDKIYEDTDTVVYRGVRKVDNLPVIMKMPKAEHPDLKTISKYNYEYEIMSTLEVPGVVKVYGLEKYLNAPILIVEDFGGQSLKHMLRERSLDLTELLAIAVQIADSLVDIHQRNLIHKDVNPSNIIINLEMKQLKLIDFGISIRLAHEDQSMVSLSMLEGTLAYISPEQTGRMNRSIDYRTDIYSFGVTLYEMLTGQLPFQVSDPLEMVHAHIAKQSIPPHVINPAIPTVLSNLVMKCLSKMAKDRYQSAFGIKADLNICLKQLRESGEIRPFSLAQQDSSDRFYIPQKLYGRENEIRLLLNTYDRISQGAAELMLVSGYSGMGKSLLVHELDKPIVRERGLFIAGKFDKYKRNIPYASLIQAFQLLIKQLLTEHEDKIELWRRKIVQAVGFNGQLLLDVLPQLELLIGKQPDVQPLQLLESQHRFRAVLLDFIRVFAAKNHPLVLFLDDLQWADTESLHFIKLLLLHSNTNYMFIIGAYRDNEVNRTHPLQQIIDDIRDAGCNVNQITLLPLDLVNVNRLIAETLHCTEKQTEPLAKLVLNKTDGNPFFINQLLNMLYDEKLIFFDQTKRAWQWEIDQIVQMNITDNVVDLLTDNVGKDASQKHPTFANALDLSTVIKASQSISDEIVLSRLLEKLMLILLENAGAQKGFLIFDHHGELFIEAQYKVGQAEAVLLHPIPIIQSGDVSETIINYVIRTREDVVLHNAMSKGLFMQDEYIIRHQVKSVICLPVINQAKLTCILYLENNLIAGAFTAERVEILKLLSSQAAISIENAKLYAGLEQSKNQLEQNVQERMKELEQMNDSYRTIFENTGTAMLIIEKDKTITLVNTEFEKLIGFAQEELIGRKWTEFSSPDINDIDKLESFHFKRRMDKDSGPQTFESRGKDKWGIVHDFLMTVSFIPGTAKSVISLLDITDRKRAEDIIRSMAYYDILTGLPNRKTFEERLVQEIARSSRQDTMLAVMFLDLDGFKAVNDTFGHEVGDKLLIEVGARLVKVMREHDVVSRLGGDEFTIILSDLRYANDADLMVSRIFEAFKPIAGIDNHEIFINSSIGVSLFPTNGNASELLIRKADSAMYAAKRRGKNNYQIYIE